jgi:hypothetical protein
MADLRRIDEHVIADSQRSNRHRFQPFTGGRYDRGRSSIDPLATFGFPEALVAR